MINDSFRPDRSTVRPNPGSVTTLWIAAGAVGLLIASAALIAGQQGPQRVTPGEVKWPSGSSLTVGTSAVAGIETVLLTGDPRTAGLYTMLLRLGPNTRIEAHAHPDDRVGTVISGTWYFGYGRVFDQSQLKALPPGSFYTEPPNANHFAMSGPEGVVIQVTGVGPSATTYVNPAHDPTRR
jgi:quercetin dioxygenase-like cupin family protein